MAEVQVCAATDVPANSVISREVGEELVAIYNIGGEYFATEARCTHGMADLADGTVMGDEIECSFHFGAFNIKTGQPKEPPRVLRSTVTTASSLSQPPERSVRRISRSSSSGTA